jgi:hypothetical protein
MVQQKFALSFGATRGYPKVHFGRCLKEMLTTLIVELVNHVFKTDLTIEKILLRFLGVMLVLGLIVIGIDWLLPALLPK